MTGWNPRGQSYQLPLAGALENRNLQPVSSSNVGNVYPIAANQSLSVSVESPQPRRVTLMNVGSIPLVVADVQRAFPYGLRLPSGDVIELMTSSALWVAAPPTVRLLSATAGIVASLGYVSVSIAG